MHSEQPFAMDPTMPPHFDQQPLPPAWLHPTAIVDGDCTIGAGTKVWDNAHIRSGARIGRKCIIGEKSYLAYNVILGDLVKLNAAVYICAQVEIEDGVLIAAHTVFTNDRFPRACDPDLHDLATSAPTEATLWTRVKRGASIGANCTIGPGLTLGEFCMIGMGSVVTRNVPAHALLIGSPARIVGLVCRCGEPVLRGCNGTPPAGDYPCARCNRTVHFS
ncbi:N-acetyltransferase [Planctomycetota bacterium]|jgi:acetyltransferase-like isoleucine patch superfamily enzyme|nr:N-acetyltransferase [Planctomycetota bacterium]